MSSSHSSSKRVGDQQSTRLSPPNRPNQTEPQHRALRYRKRSALLLLFYVPLLVIPWILTCILSGRPSLNGKNPIPYFPKAGVSPNDGFSMLSWVAAIRILNSIASVATIPVTSALLAQAAVVYIQRRKAQQKLNMSQTFSLADRGWADIAILNEARRTGSPLGSRFLWLGMILIVLSAAQHPIQNLLVTWQSVPVMTCLDDPAGGCGGDPFTVGYDPEPADIATVRYNQVIQEVMSSLSTFSDLDQQPYLWADPSYLTNDTTAVSYPMPRQRMHYWTDVMNDPNFFVTALPNGTTTGVLREHALRLNSSVQCERIPRDEFPSPCPGRLPFTTSFSNSDIHIRVCAPGEYGVTPWTLSRNRQDITEQLFLDVDSRSTNRFLTESFTLHCKASTSRGYFELGNYRNRQVYGPLLDKWPSQEELKSDFNDQLSLDAGRGFGPPTESDETAAYHSEGLNFWPGQPLDPFGTWRLNVSGPLMMSAISIFGNQSFFYIAANSTNQTYPQPIVQICQSGRIPFSTFTLTKFNRFQGICRLNGIGEDALYVSAPEENLAGLLGEWLYNFGDPGTAEEALAASMYLTNRASLTQSVSASFPFSARKIYFGAGMLVPLPRKTVAGTVVVTVLIFLQLAGLAYVTYYIYHLPSWTHALDAVAVARIGASMDRSVLPGLDGGTEKVETAKLARGNGLVGLSDESTTADPRIQLGGPDLVTRQHAVKRKQKQKQKKEREGEESSNGFTGA